MSKTELQPVNPPLSSSGSSDHETQIKLISLHEDAHDESILHFKFLISDKGTKIKDFCVP